MYQRNIKQRLIKAFESSPIVLVAGARQTGKTTLVKEIAQEKGINYYSFDDLTLLFAARKDPSGFIQGLEKPLVFDEVQRVPEIALPLKFDVDTHDECGRYILTGSANPLVIPKLNDSLAGRMLILTLWPFSQGELAGRQENFLDTIFRSDWKPKASIDWHKDNLLQALVTGGYPRMQGLSPLMRKEWCNSHLMTILERDAQDISNITRLKELPFLMQVLAARASQLLNVAEVGRVVGIPYATLTLYLAILEALFLIVRQPAWHSNRNKRLVKMPKLYVVDTGLLAYLLNVDEEGLATNPTLLGAFLENFVVQEIRKQATWSQQQVKLYHFRTQEGSEVDLVLEGSMGKVVGIEIKNSATVRENDLKGLEALALSAGSLFVRGIILYAGKQVIPFGNNIFAVPYSCLWE